VSIYVVVAMLNTIQLAQVVSFFKPITIKMQIR